jgi:hypothetical protein
MHAALDHAALVLADPQWLDQAQIAAVQLLQNGRGAVARHIQALRSSQHLNMSGTVV